MCGSGLEIALWADIRIADETAKFGVLNRMFGVPLIDGGTQRLPRIVGLGNSLELILTGKLINAKEACGIGLVNEIVSKGFALKRAL
ncbi:MAG: enoyl-CoA hydratase-related protein [Archaeoglobaceae archaeon]